MIWVHISNILKVTKFTGIARTEYELCLYAFNLKKKGLSIGFTTYDVCRGFVVIDDDVIEKLLYDLNNDNVVLNGKLKLLSRLKRSTLKRTNKLKLLCGIVYHPYKDGEKIISVGQDMLSGEMKAFELVKKNNKVNLNLLCHDLIPVNYPNYFPDKNVALFSRYINQTIKVVDNFFCNSEFTKKELTDYHSKFGLEIKPMEVITLGCDLYNKKIDQNLKLKINDTSNENFILFVSTIEVRKNHQIIYEMYKLLISQNILNLPKVFFVGRRGWKVDDFLKKFDDDKKISEYITILDNVSDLELIELYKNCWFTLYPSFIEGYGLPVAESLSFGKYCLSSNAGSLPEVGGDLIDYANPNNLEDWVSKFSFIINNPSYILEKENRIKDLYKPATWEECAKQILKI